MLAALAAVFLAASCAFADSAPLFYGAVKKGDINDDRAIDAIDASAALTYYSAIQGGTTAKNYSDVRKTAADADNNGAIDAGDASIILTHYASVQTGGKGIL